MFYFYRMVGSFLRIFGTVLKSRPSSFWCPRCWVENRYGFRRWRPKGPRPPIAHSTPRHPIYFRWGVAKRLTNVSKLAEPKEGKWLAAILKLRSSVCEFCIVVKLRPKWTCWFWKMVFGISRGTSIGLLLCKPWKYDFFRIWPQKFSSRKCIGTCIDLCIRWSLTYLYSGSRCHIFFVVNSLFCPNNTNLSNQIKRALFNKEVLFSSGLPSVSASLLLTLLVEATAVAVVAVVVVVWPSATNTD